MKAKNTNIARYSGGPRKPRTVMVFPNTQENRDQNIPATENAMETGKMVPCRVNRILAVYLRSQIDSSKGPCR